MAIEETARAGATQPLGKPAGKVGAGRCQQGAAFSFEGGGGGRAQRVQQLAQVARYIVRVVGVEGSTPDQATGMG
ncbi:hypothetical protein [Hymenobacter sp. BRD67]|uniref:hypothetical protein n=1 Tax=Hymenobacter sp. BRD67 TaxID=2675877 RepID=UPI001564BCF2|nr:hypothetical protein [Hymenobacter sp. BRD67]QKG54884.1 hypothetical protein GKZ67_20875 [Hymenobacter sp. BRD67]